MHSMVSRTLVSVLERDDRSIQFATDAFGLSEHDLRDYSILSPAMSCHSARLLCALKTKFSRKQEHMA